MAGVLCYVLLTFYQELTSPPPAAQGIMYPRPEENFVGNSFGVSCLSCLQLFRFSLLGCPFVTSTIAFAGFFVLSKHVE